MKRYLSALITVMMFSTVFSLAHAADRTIVYLDSQRILIESAAGKEAYDKLELIKNEKQKEIDGMSQTLKMLGDEIAAKSPTMKESARQELELKYEQELRKYNRFVKDAQEDLRRSEITLIKPISEEVNVIIEEYGNKNAIDIILDRRDPGIIYTSRKLDITDAILDLFDKSHQGSKEGKK
ncbi:MAG TPA: OmpH family outer membrane protein [Deltaproteobacteria bacterium]|nr:OmpH family outer membrane protein [Deltaproteobacteria bacterium]